MAMRPVLEIEAAEGIVAMTRGTQASAARIQDLERKVKGHDEDIDWLLNIIDYQNEKVRFMYRHTFLVPSVVFRLGR